MERAAGPSFEAARLGHQLARSANLEPPQTVPEANGTASDAIRGFSEAHAAFSVLSEAFSGR